MRMRNDSVQTPTDATAAPERLDDRAIHVILVRNIPRLAHEETFARRRRQLVEHARIPARELHELLITVPLDEKLVERRRIEREEERRGVGSTGAAACVDMLGFGRGGSIVPARHDPVLTLAHQGDEKL